MAKEKDLKEEVAEEIKKFWGEALKGLKKLGEEATELSKRSEGKIVEVSKKFRKEATGMARRGEEKIIGVSRMGKLSLDLMGLKKRKEEKLKEIGAEVYRAGPDELNLSSLICKEVKKIEGEVRKKEKEIKTLKKMVKGTSKPRKKKT